MRIASRAFSLVELLLAMALGLFLSGLAVTALIAAQKNVRATTQLLAQMEATRFMMASLTTASDRIAAASLVEPQPYGGGAFGAASGALTSMTFVADDFPVPSASLEAPPLRSYSASVPKISAASIILDARKVQQIGAATSSGGQGTLSGKNYRAITLSQAVTLMNQQAVMVLDMKTGAASSHAVQIWRQSAASGPYYFNSQNVYLENTTALQAAVAGAPNLYFGGQIRFIVPIL